MRFGGGSVTVVDRWIVSVLHQHLDPYLFGVQGEQDDDEELDTSLAEMENLVEEEPVEDVWLSLAVEELGKKRKTLKSK